MPCLFFNGYDNKDIIEAGEDMMLGARDGAIFGGFIGGMANIVLIQQKNNPIGNAISTGVAIGLYFGALAKMIQYRTKPGLIARYMLLMVSAPVFAGFAQYAYGKATNT